VSEWPQPVHVAPPNGLEHPMDQPATWSYDGRISHHLYDVEGNRIGAISDIFYERRSFRSKGRRGAGQMVGLPR